MNSLLFHKALGIPAAALNLVPFGELLRLEFSPHARRACLDHNFGVLRPETTLTLSRDSLHQIVEVQVRKVPARPGGLVLEKLTLRRPATFRHPSETLDMIYVIEPHVGSVWNVRTLWANRTRDPHATLDRSKYATSL